MAKELRFIVGKNIKSLREAAGLTQEELSECSSVGYKYLQSVEGKSPPNISLKVIDKLAKALKVLPSKLLSSLK